MKKQLTKSRMIGYLVLLAAVSTGVISLSYAGYKSQASMTSDVTVAAWGAESVFTIDLKDLAPGADGTYGFAVTNKKDGRISQVGQEYSIMVETMGNIPLEFTLVLAEDVADGAGTSILGRAGNPIQLASGTYTKLGTLPYAREASHPYKLTITWPAEKTEASYMDEIDLVTVTVKAEQIIPDDK
ncbi:hypothetical protein [Enterocloster hominis (ex Hitch et al. 2024)]|uniref:Secreted protein n=1 Tax=Enterocloster hominis (ex Hitch et al. 2024) TaxID=1917870 RepID=A0ABV1DDB6_9FIRM